MISFLWVTSTAVKTQNRLVAGESTLRQPSLRIKALDCRVHIDPAAWYIAVDLSYPGSVGAPKGWVVHPLKRYTSWVQYVARQYGSIYWEC